MENKTCGECRYYHPVWEHEGVCTVDETLDKACNWEKCGAWQKKEPLSNGDVIRQMSNEELAEMLSNPCSMCVYNVDLQCERIGCEQNIVAWLNAPAESEANHD